jgi:hypothetical protein
MFFSILVAHNLEWRDERAFVIGYALPDFLFNIQMGFMYG